MTEIRLALPSKGRMESETMDFLKASGLTVRKPNERQYSAKIAAMPSIHVLLQRAGDIPKSVNAGDMHLGITGYDTLIEALDGNLSNIVIIHDALGYGGCSLVVAVPEEWDDVTDIASLKTKAKRDGGLRVATKHVNSTRHFLEDNGLTDDIRIISADGALEAAPAVGYADFVADISSTGATLRDNRLRILTDGTILDSQAILIGNRAALSQGNGSLAITRQLLEMMEATLRAKDQYLVFANMRGESQEEIAARIFDQTDLGGLQGPTVSPLVTRSGESGWWAINIVVSASYLYRAIQQIRAIDGSGVIATPATYIFEEYPERYEKLLAELGVIEGTVA